MARLTNTQLSIELSTLRVAFQQLEATNALLREQQARDNKELLRRGAVINMYAVQLKAARTKCAKPNQTDFRARMEAAKAEAIRTGATVRV